MRPTGGSARLKKSTTLTLGQRPILLPLAARTACFSKEFNCVESAQDPHADAVAANDVDEQDGDDPRPAAPFPLPPLNTLASLPPRKMKTQSCRNSVVSLLRSCSIGRSTRPSNPCSPTLELRKCSPCTRPRNSMPSPAEMKRHGPFNPPEGHA